MIHLLYTIVLTEMAVMVSLVFGSPLRKVVVMGLDRLKQGKGPVVMKTVSGTIFVVFMSTIYSYAEIKKRATEGGLINPTDEVVMSNRILEASLMGFALYLAVITDRLHYYIEELHRTRRKLEELATLQKTDFIEDKRSFETSEHHRVDHSRSKSM